MLSMRRSAALAFSVLLGFRTFTPSAWALDPTEKPANYTASYWDTELGLPHNAVKRILQTRDGYLWVGTSQGLARFDGLKFTHFTDRNTPGFGGPIITSLAETADGSLWIGTSVGLTRYFGGVFTTFLEADGLKSGLTVNTVCPAPDGSLWVGGRYGITRVVDGRLVSDVDTSGHDLLGMRNITVDRTGAMWVAAGTVGLRYEAGKFTRFGVAEGLPTHGIETFRENADGVLVAATQTGLFHFVDGRFVPFERNDKLSTRRVGTIFVDRSGNTWIGSTGGLDRLHQGQVTPYVDRNGNRPGVVDAICEDREGCLWIGTGNGLYRLLDRRAQTLSTEDGITGSLITTIRQTSDDAIWIGSWGNGVDRFAAGGVTHFSRGAPLSHDTVTCIYESKDGVKWFGNRVSSLDRLEGGKITTYVYQSGVATSRYATAIYEDADGTLLLGIANRGLLELRGGQIQPVAGSPVPPTGTVWMINRLRDGRLVIGTTAGLMERTSEGRWTTLAWQRGSNPLVVRELIEENDGTMWLATEGDGLVRRSGDKTYFYRSGDGMVDDTLFSVTDDGVGSLWVTSSRGIARVRKSELAEFDQHRISRIDCLVFGRVDGLLSGSTPGGNSTGVKVKDGRILFATANGVAVIDPQKVKVNLQPPNVVIESVVVDDRQIPASGTIVIPPGANRVEIRYSSLSLIAPDRLRFRYQLKGSDPAVVEAGRERTAHYTHLDPGNYEFQVQGSNNDGVWNETGASLRITVKPRYYQTLWFRSVVAIGVVGLVGAALGLRVRQLKRKQRDLARANAELDLRVRERTAELSRSNEELQQRELLFRLIFEHAPVGVSWHRSDLGADYHFNAAFRRILDLPRETLPDDFLLAQLIHPEDAAGQALQEQAIQEGRADSYTIEQRYVRQDGRLVWGLLAAAVVRDHAGKIIQVIRLLEDITARKDAERELAATHKRLMDASRLAGMADVATGVLHNVGNVLNSVNVSATLLADGIRGSKVDRVGRLAELLGEHAANLAGFLNDDPKGRRVVPYLTALSQDLLAEKTALQAEVESLRGNVEHIHEIVAQQQSHAKLHGVLEELSPVELAEDALRMNGISIERHGISIVRDFEAVPHIVTDRHKVLQILINLIQNAKQALNLGSPAEKRLCLRISQAEEKLRFAVHDNGVGISLENLTRIFTHGFTTRQDGHGFGLHSSANAAGELGGALWAESDGEGKGATFVLEVPLVARGLDAPLSANATRAALS